LSKIILKNGLRLKVVVLKTGMDM